MKKGSTGDDIPGIGGDESEGTETKTHPRDSSQGIASTITDTASEEEKRAVKESSTQVIGNPPQPGRDHDQVPWVYARSNVKEERDMVQYYLREFVQDAEKDLVNAVEDELGTELTLTDVREAAVIAAMRHPELVTAELNRWGFETEDD